MWAAYEKEGVKPKQDWREVDATGTMQRCVRGGLVRIRMRKEREAELRAQEREKEQASSAERGGDDDLGDASGRKAGGGSTRPKISGPHACTREIVPHHNGRHSDAESSG